MTDGEEKLIEVSDSTREKVARIVGAVFAVSRSSPDTLAREVADLLVDAGHIRPEGDGICPICGVARG